MTLTIRPIHPLFCGEVSGIDLARELSPQQVQALEAGMDRYAVLLFRDQPLTDEQQMAFSRHFGELENPHGGNIPRKADDRRIRPR
jgi:alpha-ketoglutarate-dependent 2,4-dichlorophenoxyacetate dioxygenase